MNNLVLKLCPTCKEHKPFEAFSRDIRTALGLATYCRVCNRTNVRVYVAKDPEKERARQEAYRLANADRIRENSRARYIKANPTVGVKRVASTFRDEQLQEALDFAALNPRSTVKTIMQEAGLTYYLWRMIKDQFVMKKIFSATGGAVKFVYTLKSGIIDTPTQEIKHEHSIPKFREISSLAIPAPQKPAPLAISRVTVSRFATEYDD